MKTWEMIKELTENPEKEFVLKSNRNFHVFMTNYGSVFYGIIGDGAVKPLELDEYLKREWEEVKRPVDFMAAVKSGKRITLKTNINVGDKKRGNLLGVYNRTTKELLTLISEFNELTIREIILNGKFYIED